MPAISDVNEATSMATATTSTRDIVEYPLYQDLRIVPEGAWDDSDILHTINWLQQNRVVGQCWSKAPFVLGGTGPPASEHNASVRTTAGLPAIKLAEDIVAEPKVQPPSQLSDLHVWSVSKKRLTIHSPHIMELLAGTKFGVFHSLDILPGEPVEEPYYTLLYHVPVFEKALLSSSPHATDHINLLFECLDHHIQTTLNPARAIVASTPDLPIINYATLWYLFAPGTEVYFRKERHLELRGALVYRSWYEGVESNTFKVEVFYRVFGKSGLSTINKELVFFRFSGTKPITELLCCPAHYLDQSDGGKTRASCLENSRKLLGLIASEYPEVQYNGPVSWYSERDGTLVSGRYHGTVVFDHDAMFDKSMPGAAKIGQMIGADNEGSELHSALFNDSPPLDDNWWTKGRQTQQAIRRCLQFLPHTMTERHALILDHHCAVYAIKEKAWMCADTYLITEVNRLADPLKNVIIPAEDIALIQALSYRRPEGRDLWSVDFIPGKGIGKIVLLHGPPGVGKTYTVECIAEAFAMPLLSITIANMSLDEKWVERDLQMWFQLAERWNAVLLLDEADVFLERRLPADLARNALVAALLRHIEYFTGLLFLTTNRVGQIDDAFASRMHVVIGYSQIDDVSRRKIWNAFFEKIDQERGEHIIVGENARKYVLEDPEVNSLNWNGREVRNALQTVIALAEHQTSQRKGKARGSPILVEEAHFRQYMRMSRAYQVYSNKVRGGNEAKRAMVRQDRYDYPT